MAQALPESVKMVRAQLSLDTSMGGVKFPIHLGDDEVAVLLSLYWYWSMAATAGYNIVQLGLWRKTDTDPAAMESEHTDMIWEGVSALSYVTESLQLSGSEHIILPWPLILVRAPRLVGLRIGAIAAVYMRLYYLIQKVSDEELAKLMVKDHA
ncbi:hypothetical protein ES703_96065 [subsurface metagenome]